MVRTRYFPCQYRVFAQFPPGAPVSRPAIRIASFPSFLISALARPLRTIVGVLAAWASWWRDLLPSQQRSHPQKRGFCRGMPSPPRATGRNKALTGGNAGLSGGNGALTGGNKALTERNAKRSGRNERHTERNKVLTGRNAARLGRNERRMERNARRRGGFAGGLPSSERRICANGPPRRVRR
jgi:hypothetical protein